MSSIYDLNLKIVKFENRKHINQNMIAHEIQQQQFQQLNPMSVSLNQRLQGGAGSTSNAPSQQRYLEQEPALTESNPNLAAMQQPQMQLSGNETLQDDFTLLDVIGGAGLSVLHPTKPIVAYTSGCIIIVFDLMSDTKIQLTSHEHEVHALAFTPAGAGGLPGQGGDFLISIDFNRNEPNEENGPLSRLFIWDWRQGHCIQQVRIPSSMSPSLLGAQQLPSVSDLRAGKPLRFYKIVFDKSGSTFLVLESSTSDVGGGYRASVWNFNRAQSVGLVSHDDLDLQQTCLGVCMLQNQSKPTTMANPMYNTPTGQVSQVIAHGDQNSQLAQIYLTNTIQFLTVESSCIKIWEMAQGAFELKKRIHIKQEISQCIVSELTGFMLILGSNGKVLILDGKGDFVSTVSKQGAFFTHIGTCDDRLLLGTEKGTVHAYHIASLQFINEIPYQIALLPDNCINQDPLYASQEAKATRPLNKLEEALLKVGPPVNGIQATKDKRFLMLSYKDSSFAVIDRQVVSSLSDAILGYQYGHFEGIAGLQWIGGSPAKMGGPVLSDQYQLIHQASECFATCSSDLSVYIWRHFGDRWQTQYIDITKCFDRSLSYQRKNCDKSTASLKLTALQVMPRRQTLAVADNRGTVRVFELGADQATLVSTHQLMRSPEMLGDAATAIKEVFFTSDEQVAVITYDTGLVSAYDVRGGFTWLGDIEKEVPRLGQTSTSTLSKVLERNDMRDEPNGGHLINHFRPVNSQETKFSVFSLRGPNCVKQQLVEVRDNRLGITPLTQFFIDSGKVAGFDIHPSKDYVLITSTKGKIYVFRIDTGELRGTIDVPLHAQGCLIDPSGLYVVVKVPPFSPRHTSNLTNQGEEFANMGLNEKDLSRTTILMYEVGTRRVAAEVHSIFDISTMQFSSDGRYLSLGSYKGAVSVWALGDHLFRAVHEVIERMKAQQDFWCNYPIYLPDHNSQGRSQSQSNTPFYPNESRSSVMFTPHQVFGQDELLKQRQNLGSQFDQMQNQQEPFAPQPLWQPDGQQQYYPEQPQQLVGTLPRQAGGNFNHPNEHQQHESHADQTPLRMRQKEQQYQQPEQPQQQPLPQSSHHQTNQASYNDQNQAQSRIYEVEAHSQDVQPSNYAGQANDSSQQIVQQQHLSADMAAGYNQSDFQQDHQQTQQQYSQQQQMAHPNQSQIAKPSTQNDESDQSRIVYPPSNDMPVVDEQANAQRFLRKGPGGSDFVQPQPVEEQPVRMSSQQNSYLERAASRSAIENPPPLQDDQSDFLQRQQNNNDQIGRATERVGGSQNSINELLPNADVDDQISDQQPPYYQDVDHGIAATDRISNSNNNMINIRDQQALPSEQQNHQQTRSNAIPPYQPQYSNQAAVDQSQHSQQKQQQQPSERQNNHSVSASANKMDQLYRKQSPLTRPLRREHEYVDQPVPRQQMLDARMSQYQQQPSMQQQFSQSANIRGGIEMMPSAHEVMLGQSLPNNYKPGLDGYGFDQTRYSQAQTHYSQTAGQRRFEPLQQQQMPPSIHQQYPGMQYEPVDIDTGMPRGYQQNQQYSRAGAPQRPPQQMLYTDTGVIIPEQSPHELPAPGHIGGPTTQSPLMPNAYGTQNMLLQPPMHPQSPHYHHPPSFGQSMDSQQHQASYQSPHFAANNNNYMSSHEQQNRPPVETAWQRATNHASQHLPAQVHQQHQQHLPHPRTGTSSTAAQDIARAYHEVDEFEARMQRQRMVESYSNKGSNFQTTGQQHMADVPVDQATSNAVAPPQSNYARDLIGRSFQAK